MTDDLPSTSPAREVIKDVLLEIAQINRMVTDFLDRITTRITGYNHEFIGWHLMMTSVTYVTDKTPSLVSGIKIIALRRSAHPIRVCAPLEARAWNMVDWRRRFVFWAWQIKGRRASG